MAQKTVNMKQAFGIEGEFYDSSIKRATNVKLGANAKIGKPLFRKADGTIIPVGADATSANYIGFAVNPKEHINLSGLDATMEIAAGKYVANADKGRVIVKVANAVKVGEKVYACKTAGTGTGETTNYAVGDICGGTAAPSSTAAGGGVFVELTGAKFDIVDAAAGDLAVVVL